MGRIFIIILLSYQSLALANSCCGQTPASFVVLNMKQTLSASLGYSYMQAQGRVFNNPDEFFIWNNDKRRIIQSTQLSLAGSLSSRHQISMTTALMSSDYRSGNEQGSSQNLSDTLIGYHFELLPEYTYSAWKPVVFVSTFLNLPTGQSIYDPASLSEGADVTGHNQWGYGVGLTLRKVYFPLTLTWQSKWIHLIEEEFQQATVSDFEDISSAFLLDYTAELLPVTLTTGVTWSYLSPRRIGGLAPRSGSSEVTSFLASILKTIDDSWALSLAYNDQTLLGRPRNIILNRTLTFNINYNYF